MNACRKEKPEPPNEEEVITTLIYTLTDTATQKKYEFKFTDIDGDGGMSPIIKFDTLPKNSVFNATIILLNEQNNPAENITKEIEAEQEDHQFFYSSNSTSLTFEYSDKDKNGNPIGLTTLVKTKDIFNGNLTVTLKHEPDKNANGVKNGDKTNAGGQTDIEVTFPLSIK